MKNSTSPQTGNMRLVLTRLLLGAGTLLGGIFVYLTARPPGSAYFVEKMLGVGWERGFPGPFSIPMASVLPAFTHVFGFSMICSAVLTNGKKFGAGICIFWTLLNAAFEVGQLYGRTISKWIPRFFDAWPFLENSRAFFIHGVFDPLDLAAAALGGLAAYGAIRITERGSKPKA